MEHGAMEPWSHGVRFSLPDAGCGSAGRTDPARRRSAREAPPQRCVAMRASGPGPVEIRTKKKNIVLPQHVLPGGPQGFAWGGGGGGRRRRAARNGTACRDYSARGLPPPRSPRSRPEANR